MKILCIGNSTYDITYPMEGYPVENTKNRLTNVKVECGGGPASNAAYLIGKWGGNVTFAGCVGDDIEGKNAIKELKSVGVNTKYLEIIDGKETTSSLIIANTLLGTRTILTNKDFNLKMPKGYKIKENYDAILVDGTHYELEKDVLKNNPNALKIIDAGSYKESAIKLGKYVDYFVCSNDFAKEYTKIDFDYADTESLKKVYDILKKDFKNNVIITLESQGCFTKINDQYTKIKSIKVKAIDSTGAGDIFHGALTYFLINNFDLRLSLELANITGALSVTKIGGRFSMPTLEEVVKNHQKYYE